MATLQLRNQSYRVLFCYRGCRYTFTLGAIEAREAELASVNVERLLLRLEQRLLKLLDGMDIVTFLKHDGKPPEAPREEDRAPDRTTLAALRDAYLAAHSIGAWEENSLGTVRMHLGHFKATLGEHFDLRGLTLGDLQRHVNTRAKKKYRGKPLSPATLNKEMATLRAAWNWGALTRLVQGSFPGKGLVYPKADEKPPFLTWAEVERKLPGLSEHEQAELWDCLFLTQPEVTELLEHVRANASLPWVYPAVCFAAHTGARRSEVLRARLQDLDLDGGTVTIREKKHAKGKRTMRRVPLSPLLGRVLRD